MKLAVWGLDLWLIRSYSSTTVLFHIPISLVWAKALRILMVNLSSGNVLTVILTIRLLLWLWTLEVRRWSPFLTSYFLLVYIYNLSYGTLPLKFATTCPWDPPPFVILLFRDWWYPLDTFYWWVIVAPTLLPPLCDVSIYDFLIIFIMFWEVAFCGKGSLPLVLYRGPPLLWLFNPPYDDYIFIIIY